MRRRSVQFVLGLMLMALAASCGGNSGNEVPLIFAAASVSDVLTESAAIYERETGMQVEFSFGGSLTLANQIAKFGAPADGVFFVGEEPKTILGELVNPVPEGSIGLVNTLLVIGFKDAEHVGTLSDLAASDAQVVIADPALAPAGQFAKQALESAGVWQDIENDLIFAVDVRAVLAAVESGNSDYGIVYRTDAFGSDSVSIMSEIYEGYSPIIYVGRSVKLAENSASAVEFFEFLSKSPTVRDVFESAGFTIGFAGEAGT
ncbi:MAG: molybdate ABC transporter substrate-binding protein [Chloroflexi bacterium]|nr:molybdate ABC transporter substrate-binding protein [Chloroflexota bacterium]